MARLTFTNRAGIPALETVGTTLTSSGETFNFNRHPYFTLYFQGIFLVKVSGTQTAPSAAVPIYFNTPGLDNSNVPVCNASGASLTTDDWPGDGVYLFFYDRTTNVLRLLTGNIS